MDALQDVRVDVVEVLRLTGGLAGDNQQRWRPFLKTYVLNQPDRRYRVRGGCGRQNEKAVGVRSQVRSNGPVVEVRGSVPELLQMSHYRIGKARVVSDQR